MEGYVMTHEGHEMAFASLQELWDHACEIAAFVQVSQINDWIEAIDKRKKTQIPKIILDAFEE